MRNPPLPNTSYAVPGLQSMLAPVHVMMAQGEASGLGHLLTWSSLLHNPCKGSTEVRAETLLRPVLLPKDRPFPWVYTLYLVFVTYA